MGRKGPRAILFVCSACENNQLISHKIEAKTSEEALELFEKEYSVKVQSIHGPFHEKRVGVLDSTKNIKFNGQSKTAVYNGWIVNALFLKDPENCAYLLFDKRVDDKKMPKPTGTFIVKIDDLRNIK